MSRWLFVMVVALCGCTEAETEAEAAPPELLRIDSNPFLPTTESVVIFSIDVLNEEDGPFTYEWSLGDGTTSTMKLPSHKYTEAGEYGVSVTVTNEAGSDSDTTSISISNPDADLYFWTQYDVNGPIQVTINGITKAIIAVHPQFPGCARGSGMAEFTDLPYGTYSYTAVAQSGMQWSNSITLDDNCANIQLY